MGSSGGPTTTVTDRDCSESSRPAVFGATGWSRAGRLGGYLSVVALGALLRILTMRQYVGHIDEPASLLAIKQVADLGYPLFPSDVLYLQGAAFSYVAAPLAWFFDNDALLHAARVLHICTALLIIPLSMKLVHCLTNGFPVALLTGILIACDPMLIIWGVAIRPYGLLAAEVVALVLLFTVLVRDGPQARMGFVRIVYWIPAVATLGAFTHIGFALSFAAVATACIMVWRGALLDSARPILFSGAVSVIPFIMFLLLGRFVGVGSGTGNGPLGETFVGSHLFSTQGLTDLSALPWNLWTRNFLEGAFYALMPFLITLMSGVVLHGALSAPTNGSDHWRLQASGSILLVHWSMILVVMIVSSPGADPRYLTQVLPLGYVVLGLAAWRMWVVATQHHPLNRHILRMGTLGLLVIPALLYTSTASSWRIGDPGGNPGYWQATSWAAEHMSDDHVLLTAMPPAAYFWFPEQRLSSFYFLAGPAGSARTELFTKRDIKGNYVDYWLGITPINSEQRLCEVLRQHAGNAWIVVDVGRLHAPWAFKGRMRNIIVGASTEQYRGPNRIVVMFVDPVDAWRPDARSECGL